MRSPDSSGFSWNDATEGGRTEGTRGEILEVDDNKLTGIWRFIMFNQLIISLNSCSGECSLVFDFWYNLQKDETTTATLTSVFVKDFTNTLCFSVSRIKRFVFFIFNNKKSFLVTCCPDNLTSTQFMWAEQTVWAYVRLWDFCMSQTILIHGLRLCYGKIYFTLLCIQYVVFLRFVVLLCGLHPGHVWILDKNFVILAGQRFVFYMFNFNKY